MDKEDIVEVLENELGDMPWEFKLFKFGNGKEEDLWLDLKNRPLEDLEKKAQREAREKIKEAKEGDVILISEVMDSAITKENGSFFKGKLKRVENGFSLCGKMEELSEEEAIKVLREEYEENTLANIPNRADIKIDRIDKIYTYKTGDIKAVGISLKDGGEIEFRNNRGISFSFP